MWAVKPEEIKKIMRKMGAKGGLARARKHSKAELVKWGKRGGRPKGSGKKSRKEK